MAWYVFAIVDRAPSGRPGRGLGNPLAVRRIPGGLAVVEQRADVPPIEFGTLQKHQAVVTRLAGSVPAILPVRFGTLLESSEIDEALDERGEEIAEAFDLVRNRVQFTWRTRLKKTGKGKTGGEARAAASGAEYLRQAARAANPAPPAAFRALASKLAPLVVGERYQPATATVPDSLYHLVERSAASRYAAAADTLRDANPQFTMTGPFPPFAFAPEIL
jgi:glutathione S-transferase